MTLKICKNLIEQKKVFAEKIPMGEGTDKYFWLYYVDGKALQEKKEYIVNLKKKWQFGLKSEIGRFLENKVKEYCGDILKGVECKGWKVEADVRKLNGVKLDKRIDVLVTLPERYQPKHLWIECKNLTKPTTQKHEIGEFMKNVDVVQKLLGIQFRRVLVCSMISEPDRDWCLDNGIKLVIVGKQILPYERDSENFGAYCKGILEFELGGYYSTFLFERCLPLMEGLWSYVFKPILGEAKGLLWLYKLSVCPSCARLVESYSLIKCERCGKPICFGCSSYGWCVDCRNQWEEHERELLEKEAEEYEEDED